MEKGRKSHLLVSLLILIPTQCIFPPVNSLADYITLSWDRNHEPDLAGYRIYYGKSSGNYDHMTDVGNISSHRLSGLEPDTRYYVALTAYDTSGNESDLSNEVSGVSNPEPPSISTSSGEGGCFIATAAYSSHLHHNVIILREFRNKFLFSNSIGRICVYMYYQLGPPIADHIKKYGFLRRLVREALLPLIGMSSLALETTTSERILLLWLCLLVIPPFYFLPLYSRRPRLRC